MINDILKEKCKLIKFYNDNLYFKKKWEELFLENLTEEEKRNIYINDFLWHACSYNKINNISGKRAIQLFNKQSKKDIIIFYQENNNAFYCEDAKNLNYSDIKNEMDIYISDINFNWSFIITHEKMCGPYFLKR